MKVIPKKDILTLTLNQEFDFDFFFYFDLFDFGSAFDSERVVEENVQVLRRCSFERLKCSNSFEWSIKTVWIHVSYTLYLLLHQLFTVLIYETVRCNLL